MENINSTIVDITFIDGNCDIPEHIEGTEPVPVPCPSPNKFTITYDNGLTETLVVGKETYNRMYIEWLKEQPPFISDVYKQNMNNLILSSIHNNQKCIADLNGFFRVENKDEVINFIKYMRGRDLTQEKLRWNKSFVDLYNNPIDQQAST
uniref:Uncharacterized protein n=1 Tax=viral metagenome TaxID=1070528 RepID=A0A6C0K913_9ZZZZ